MNLSTFDLFSIGIGPSSSHTVGPMKAAKIFAEELSSLISNFNSLNLKITLYGSLGFTGKAHGSEKAVYLGLEGKSPDDVDPAYISERVDYIEKNLELMLISKHKVRFNPKTDLIFNRTETLPLHSNGMKFQAYNNTELILEKILYSIGGGFLQSDSGVSKELRSSPKFPFSSAKDLLKLCFDNKLSICELMRENEHSWYLSTDISKKISSIWSTMSDCIDNGCKNEGILPGGLKVKRRAPQLYKSLKSSKDNDPLKVLDWVSTYAIAVNEENAAGGRVVTAPTNGAAGIIPAVIKYYITFCRGTRIEDFILTASAIGILFKLNASISGAEVGCQGEVGVASSMAAAGLTQVMGGTPEQVENAAEIAMEHHLGMTCDPIGGLVQVPCIERNAMGAIKAINASRLALQGDGTHVVSLDKVIKTMKATGDDMKDKYKETSRGGLAVNVVEC